jgi:hypothetical protein
MEFKKDEFLQELEDLCDKYELTNICFGSTLKSEMINLSVLWDLEATEFQILLIVT